MSKKLNENIGAVEYDSIFAGACHADVVTVQLAANIGVLKRGTIVVGELGGGPVAPMSSSTTVPVVYILTDDVDTSVTTEATAYRTGCFNRNKLFTDGKHVLSQIDVDLFRAAGILLSDAIEA